MALEYGDRIRGMQCFADEPLLSEFRRCQELVAQEAVHNSMVATCRALGLWQEGAPVDEDCAWQDCSQPLEVVARRLQNHAAQVDAAGLTEKLSRRTRQASFVVEFGLEHGLPPLKDATSEATLTDFLERIKEWDGGHDNEMSAPPLPGRSLPGLPAWPRPSVHSLAPPAAGAIALTLALALPHRTLGPLPSAPGPTARLVRCLAPPASTGRVRALVMENLSSPSAAVPPSLRDAASDWFQHNQKAAIIGGAIFGGVLGLLAAGAAVAASAGAKTARRR